MLTVDIQLPDVEELQRLVEIGLERGFVTYDEVSAVVDEVELTKEQVEDFYTYLFEHGVGLADCRGQPRRHAGRARRRRRRSTSRSSRAWTRCACTCARSAACRC